MKILLTGASGFLGTIIQQVFVYNNHNVVSLGRNNSVINCDLSRDVPVLPAIDLLVHSAGKAHSIPKSVQEINEFYNINVAGTINLLKALDGLPVLPQSFVFISSVAVYGKEYGSGIDEQTSLGAKDPYGKSKIEAEHLVENWCVEHKVRCAILRLPLIAGPNPLGNLKAMIDGIRKGYYFNIAGGNARKSIVLAEDIARIIPRAAEAGGIFNLTDGYHPSFSELSGLIAKQLGKGKPYDIPRWLAMLMARAGNIIGVKAPINTSKLVKITSNLTFDDSKARRELGWDPTPVLEGFRIT